MCSVRSHIFFLCCCPPSHATVNTTNVALETEPETLLEAAHLGVSGPLWGPRAPCSPATCAQAAKLLSAFGYHSNAQHVPKQDASGLIQPQGVDIMAAMIYPARRKAELKKGCQQQSRAPAKSEEETLCVLCLCFVRRTLSIEGTGQSRSAWPMKSAAKATVATGGGLGFSNCRRKERRSIFYEKKNKTISLLKHGLLSTWLSAPWLHKWRRGVCNFLLSSGQAVHSLIYFNPWFPTIEALPVLFSLPYASPFWLRYSGHDIE